MTTTIDILNPSFWQMTFGERAALEGILGQLKPRVAIEIGTAEGGSLRRVAEHSDHVHSFDLVRPEPAVEEIENVTFHTGDSHALLRKLLNELAGAGENVDFALVDGDHSADGVERDMLDLIRSGAARRLVILAHDTMNDEVREGLLRIDYEAEPKVVFSDLDFVSGHLSQGGDFHHQLWGGLGLVVVDAAGGSLVAPSRTGERFYDLFEIVSAVRDEMAAREQGSGAQPDGQGNGAEVLRLRDELAQSQRALDEVQRSLSWRVTAPLRAFKPKLPRPLSR